MPTPLTWERDTVPSTGVCPYCQRYASPVTRLYAELRNDQASWHDAVFWLVLGAIVSALAQVGIEHLWAWWGR